MGSSETLPTFLVIGAMKSGTTSLYRYLSSHPQVFMSTPKELHFFSHGQGKGLGWYEERFTAAGDAAAVGEASASYTTYGLGEMVPSRIRQAMPDVRLIYVVRHPIERMRSHYFQRVAGGDEGRPIDRALLTDPLYLETSRYARWVDRYLEHFPIERILVVTSEALRDERRETMRTIFGFLRVDETQWDPAVMDHEFYRTSDKQVPRRSVRAIRRTALARRVLTHVPTSAKRLGVRVTTETPEPDHARISESTRSQLTDLLAEDVLRLRPHMDPAFDGWGIA